MTAASPGGGRRLGRYHLGDFMGGGPNGDVYRGNVYGVAGFERKFAVKRFHPALVRSPAMAAKVASATRAYGSLEHPHIARLHEFGVAGGETFTATELVEGIDLARLLNAQGGMLAAGAGCALLVTAARAVGYAHGRGHAHLGLCPTNVLVTTDGSVKLTDFGILPPRLGNRPGQDESLSHRLPFIAPEQLAGEPTSAATDVYQLGVLTFLILTGEGPFRAPSSFELAQQILSGQPPNPDLPKPLAKLVRRCLARSPFERYPDARAMAEALAKAAGDAGFVGDVRELAAVVAEEKKKLDAEDPSSRDVPPSMPPEPPGLTPAPTPGRVVRGPQAPDFKKTMMAVSPPPPKPKPPPPLRTDSVVGPARTTTNREGLGPAGGTGVTGDSVSVVLPAPSDDAAPMKLGPAGPSKSGPVPAPGAMPSDKELEEVLEMDAMGIGDVGLIARRGDTVGDDEEIETEIFKGRTRTPARGLGPKQGLGGGGLADLATIEPDRPLSAPIVPSAPALEPPPDTIQPQPPIVAEEKQPETPELAEMPPTVAPKEKKGGMAWVAVLLAVLLAGGGGFFAYRHFSGDEPSVAAGAADDASTANQAPAIDAASQPVDAAAAKASDGGVVAVVNEDAGAVTDGGTESAADAGALAQADAGAPSVTGKLKVTSKPRGATVYLDGAESGETPVELELSGDKHRLALILPGHKLYVSDIDGSTPVNAVLESVTPTGGSAGIKVRCKKKNRYYVTVDGRQSGMLCPTERIGVKKGKHVVEIYDPINDSSREFNINIKQTRRSHRLYID